jgi:hypothetical protein
MYQDAVAGTCVHQETPFRVLVQHVDQLPRGDSLEPPLAAQFPDQ